VATPETVSLFHGDCPQDGRLLPPRMPHASDGDERLTANGKRIDFKNVEMQTINAMLVVCDDLR